MISYEIVYKRNKIKFKKKNNFWNKNHCMQRLAAINCYDFMSSLKVIDFLR